MESLRNKVAVITGTSSGIGRETAKILAAEGCRVGLVARREAHLRELAAEIGDSACVAAADVRDFASLGAAVATIRGTLGPIDLAIANAGVDRPTRLDPVNVADVEEMFHVNVLGMVNTFAAVLPEMLARRSGRVVAVSSLAGYRGLPGESAYCASKAAVISYMDGLRIQLRGTGVFATTVCPGFVQTAMTAHHAFQMPGVMSAEAAAGRIVRAVKSGRKVCDFPWQVSLITKLSRWVPDVLMRWVMDGYTGGSRAADRSAALPHAVD
jgi:NADP-dependent 3-hydroxy acid dehydrogenase YdfG